MHYRKMHACFSWITVCHIKTSTNCPVWSSLKCVCWCLLWESPLFQLFAGTVQGCLGQCPLWTFNWLDLAMIEHHWAACRAFWVLWAENPISTDPSQGLSLCVWPLGTAGERLQLDRQLAGEEEYGLRIKPQEGTCIYEIFCAVLVHVLNISCSLQSKLVLFVFAGIKSCVSMPNVKLQI